MVCKLKIDTKHSVERFKENRLHRPAYLEIDLKRLAQNTKNIKGALGTNVGLLSVVKADAYGHGAYEVSRVVLENGADSLGVAILEEGIELRERGIDAPVVILYPEFYGREEKILEYYLRPTVTDFDFARMISEEAKKQGKVAEVYLKIDTGMGRYGISPEELLALVKKIDHLENVKIKGIFSQLSEAEGGDKENATEQIGKFQKALVKLKFLNHDGLIRSIANSAAVLDLPESYFNQVRVGLLLYGLYPSKELSNSIKVKPVMSLKSRVLFLKEVGKGSPIGYGGAYVTKRKTKVATIPLGYADGYPRLLSNKGEVLIRGKKAPIIGRICMDAFMVDVTDVPEVRIGDVVTLLGEDKGKEITADDLAFWSSSINYEIISRMGRRLPKVYLR